MTAEQKAALTCSVDGCPRPLKARGWCRMHYKRWQKHGDPNEGARTIQAVVCRAEGCERKPLSRSLCQMYLIRMKKRGSLELPPPATDDERFWAKVDKNGPAAVSWDGTPLPGQCWLWLGAADGDGYGKFCFSRTDRSGPQRIGPHRYSYQQLVATIPSDLTIDHLCRNPRCVNPFHLEPVTQAENNRRAVAARASVYTPKEKLSG